MLHGFMHEGDAVDILEDLGHILLGLLPIDLLLWVREFTRAKLPWPFKGQWPPGEPAWIHFDCGGHISIMNYKPTDGSEYGEFSTEITQMDRVSDLARDQLGYAIGQQLRVCLLVGLLWWRW